MRERVKPLFYTRMRLGEFDPPEMNPYLSYNLSVIQSPEHRALSVKAAMQTFVLLKNENRLLPIKKHFNKIAVSIVAFCIPSSTEFGSLVCNTKFEELATSILFDILQ